MAVPAFETIGKVPVFDDIAAAPTDIATMPDDRFPEEVREEADHIRNAYYYSRNLGLDPNVAYDYEPQINELLYGPGTTSASAWAATRGKILGARRKGLGTAVEHAAVNVYQNGQRVMAGMGRLIAETEAKLPKPSWDKSGLGLADPVFRWLFGVPDDVDVAQFMTDLSNAVSADIKQSQEEHPERGLAIDPDAGYAETLWQIVFRPENLLQGTLESVPMILEGILGTIAAGPGGAIVAMAGPRLGEIYHDARADGTEVWPAFAQALITSGIEATIEQWTLGKKLALGKNVKQILTGGPGRTILWEGTKAFWRGSAEEGSQQFNENFWRWVFTDRSQKWFEGVQQATAVGGPLEMAMSGAFAAAGRIGTPVEYREAQRRLNLLRKIVQSAPMSESERAEIMAELDKVEGIVPDILLADGAMEVPGGEEQVPAGEGTGPVVAPGAPAAAEPGAVVPEAQVPGGQVAGEAPVVEAAAGDIETPDEAKVAEAKLKTEGREIVEPKLYIGNVTARMKGVMSEALTEATGKEVAPADIGPFKEGAWPTKRTKVELTRGQAEQYLDWLEADLARRLDKNLIRTHDDMARANADWGDVAALRKVLGLPQTPRPWSIVADQKRGEVIRDQGEVKAAQREIEQLRKEFDLAKTDMEADEILGQIEAKQLEIDRLQRVLGKAVKVVKDTQSAIFGAVQPSRLQESKMTVGQVLSAVLKRSARFAKMGFAQGRRELRADMRAKARAKARLRAALKTIKQKIPKSTDFFYREAIEALRSNFDLKHRSERTLSQRKATKEFLARIPENEKENIPSRVFAQVTKTPLNDLTIEQVENIAAEVDKLVALGKLKRKLVMRPVLEQRVEDLANLTESVEASKPMKLQTGPKVESTKEGLVKTAFDKTKLWTWTPARWLDMLDGGKGTFSGLWHRIFYDGVKTAKRASKNFVLNAQSDFLKERKRLGISLLDIVRSRIVTVDGREIKMTTQEIMGVYMSSLNPRNKLHLIYGNQFTEKGIADVVKAMTENEKALADWMLNWYEQQQPNLRRAVIEQENRDMGKEDSYSPILPKDTTWKNLQEEVRRAVDQRLQLRAHNVAHGFTLARKDVPEWMRGEIRLDAVNIFTDQVQKQSRYIHLGPHVRRMNKLRGNKPLRKVIDERFGTEMLKMLDGYVGAVANPYIYRQYSLPERLSAKLRQNTAIAYLAFNLTTMAKQPAAILFYLPDAGPGHLLASIMDFATNPMEMIQKVRSLDPEVAELSMEREFEEIKRGQNANVIKGVVTDAGLQGIYFFDQIARTIGWNAVYERAKADGKSEAEAIRMAQDATLRTQNAADAEDIPALYRTSEFLNWFTLFTNQVSKMYNLATYDIPAWFGNDEYAKGALGLAALSINALVIWMITHRKFPEEPEEWADLLSSQSIELIPVIGKPILDMSEGWGTDAPLFTPLKVASEGREFVMQGLEKGKWELTRADIQNIAEGLSVGVGLPYTGIKRAVQAVEEQQPGALVGARKPAKKKVTTLKF